MSIEWNFEPEKVRKVTSLKVCLVLLKAYKVLPEVLACNGLSENNFSMSMSMWVGIHIPSTSSKYLLGVLIPKNIWKCFIAIMSPTATFIVYNII